MTYKHGHSANPRVTGNNPVDEYFPLHTRSSESQEEEGPCNDPVVNTLPAARLAAEESMALRSGQSHVIYSTHDVLGILPGEFESVIERAARWAGVSSNDVCGVVERFERRTMRWWEKNRRREERN